MSEASFGASAAHLCALAARMLGWRPGEFWQATPAELAAILAPPASGPALSRGDLARLIEQEHSHG